MCLSNFNIFVSIYSPCQHFGKSKEGDYRASFVVNCIDISKEFAFNCGKNPISYYSADSCS